MTYSDIDVSFVAEIVPPLRSQSLCLCVCVCVYRCATHVFIRVGQRSSLDAISQEFPTLFL